MFKFAVFRSPALSALAALALLHPAVASAQSDFPSKPVRIVVGYPPGGAVDNIARIVGDAFGPRLRTPIVIDNQGGAAGAIAAQRVVNSAADGYTLLAGSSNEMAATGLVNPAQKYDPQKDFTPIGLVSTGPVVLVAGPKTGIKTLAEFMDRVRREPGKYSYGSSGVGSTLHFAGELLKQRGGLFITHIPYRGTAPLASDLAGGSIEFAVMSPTAVMPFIQSGRLVPLAVTSAQRIALLPDVPALGEHPGLKGYELVGWYAVAAPRNLPPEVGKRLSQTLQDALRDPATRRRLDEAGMVPATGREDLGQLIRTDMEQYRRLVEFAHMKE
jgi:tripartite-type tricarboxylate transporter receptor subunit TctC